MSAKASGLHSQLSRAVTLLGLQVAVIVIGPLECFNRIRKIQSKIETVAGILECVRPRSPRCTFGAHVRNGTSVFLMVTLVGYLRHNVAFGTQKWPSNIGLFYFFLEFIRS